MAKVVSRASLLFSLGIAIAILLFLISFRLRDSSASTLEWTVPKWTAPEWASPEWTELEVTAPKLTAFDDQLRVVFVPIVRNVSRKRLPVQVLPGAESSLRVGTGGGEEAPSELVENPLFLWQLQEETEALATRIANLESSVTHLQKQVEDLDDTLESGTTGQLGMLKKDVERNGESIATLHTDVDNHMTAIRSDVNANMTAIRNDVNANMTAIRNDSNTNMTAIRDDSNTNMTAIRGDVDRIEWIVGVVALGTIAVIADVFAPTIRSMLPARFRRDAKKKDDQPHD